ncbi:MAG: ATP-binding protein [Firmicutes bacterium]|jgi:SpoVK/Ycf46/Vps4 family AAA+-type ATPase|nr:ATP-binding protein [Bacillota bacterium]
MKSGLVVKLIEAHSSGNEDAFKNAVNILADDEEKKGNSTTALLLRNAYIYKKNHSINLADSPISEMSFSTQSSIPMPKDKDSTLELLEILTPKVTLKDVALPEKTLSALEQIVSEQKSIELLMNKGIFPSNRLLFCGPPGCGKTLTANALAGELNIPVAYVKLDGLVSSYLGQTGTNIRKIFDFAKNKRIMLFLDEFDAIAKKRDDTNELGELKRVVTTLLQNMDSMPANVFLVAATNHHHLLDPAIWRRFNSSILLELPIPTQRQQMIEKFFYEKLPEYKIDIKTLVILTDGMSGAEIQSFIQALAKHCVMEGIKKNISQKQIAEIWLQQNTLFISENSEDFMKALYKLKKNGVSLRTLEEITSIPKSTLNYRFKKENLDDE